MTGLDSWSLPRSMSTYPVVSVFDHWVLQKDQCNHCYVGSLISLSWETAARKFLTLSDSLVTLVQPLGSWLSEVLFQSWVAYFQNIDRLVHTCTHFQPSLSVTEAVRPKPCAHSTSPHRASNQQSAASTIPISLLLQLISAHT